jgi:hypothetical protein
MTGNDTTPTNPARASDAGTASTRGWIPAQPRLHAAANPWQGRGGFHPGDAVVTVAARPLWFTRLQSRA